MTTIAPIRRSVEVKATPETAFALFTAHIGAWWPVARHSVYGASGVVAFEGDRLVERSPEGIAVWAEVLEWDPPRQLRLAWHAGHDASKATDVHVAFEPRDDVTVVTLVHSDWERTDHPEEASREYANGWPTVLDRFVGKVSHWDSTDPVDADRETGRADRWFTLVHTPGPAIGEGESVFAHPLFGEHLAFLERLRAQRLLVAAGPVMPERGEGMRLVRVPASRPDIDVVELASADDLSVRDGLLVVDVRAWDVRFTG